jgi:chromosome partitioning protein
LPAKVVSFINLRGGVGKSTLSMMAAEFLFFRFHKRVLAIDLDSQANLTFAMVPPERIRELRGSQRTIYHLFLQALQGRISIQDVVARPPLIVSNVARGLGVQRTTAALDMVISLPDLAQLDEQMLVMWEQGETAPKEFRYVLKKALAPVLEDYDVVIIDCPPGLSVLTSNALVASDYYVCPVIPEPLSILGVDLVTQRVRVLRERVPDTHVEFGGCILNKVMYYRKSHAIEAPRLYGAQVGTMPRFPRERYNPFHWWVPDSERLRKLGEYESDELDVGPEKFGTINNKYETGTRLTNNPGSHLSRHEQEGPTYTLSPRLERVVQKLAERIQL